MTESMKSEENPETKSILAPPLAVPGLTGKRLALLAAVLARDEKEKPTSSVERALHLWNEAHRAVLSPSGFLSGR